MSHILSQKVKLLFALVAVCLAFAVGIGLGTIFMSNNPVDIKGKGGIWDLHIGDVSLFMLFLISVFLYLCLTVAVLISNIKTIETAKAAKKRLVMENIFLAQLNQMKTELMTTISHETRTPLAVIASYSGFVAMELKNKKGNEEITDDLDVIVEEAKRVANLIDSMKQVILSKDGTSKKRMNLDFGEIIRQLTGLYHHLFEQSGIKLEIVVEDGLVVFGSAEELKQVLFNLLQNARNHTEKGKVSVTAKREANDVVVIVSDTGTGIAPELLPYLFERGVSTTEFGMGIGLALCKEVIDDHNGKITIESQLRGINQGTRVRFTLPVVREENGNGS